MPGCPVLAPSPVEAGVHLGALDVQTCRGTRQCIRPSHLNAAFLELENGLDSLNMQKQATTVCVFYDNPDGKPLKIPDPRRRSTNAQMPSPPSSAGGRPAAIRNMKRMEHRGCLLAI